MKEMFQDYKTKVKEPRKEFNKIHRKEIIILIFDEQRVISSRAWVKSFLNVAVYAVLIGGSYIVSNREMIVEKIKSKFNNGKRI